MPLYEYQCDACAHRFEVIQKYSDAPVDACPKCGGAVSKLLSSPAIQFKGSGWYITDYARSGKSDPGSVASGRNESGGSGPAPKSDSTVETKPEAKTEPTPSASPAKSD
jgi:putative FmdB family regulatory protein